MNFPFTLPEKPLLDLDGHLPAPRAFECLDVHFESLVILDVWLWCLDLPLDLTDLLIDQLDGASDRAQAVLILKHLG